MGSLIGHLVPGTFFGLFAIWWIFELFQRYFECHFQGIPFKSPVSNHQLNNNNSNSQRTANNNNNVAKITKIQRRKKSKLPPIETSIKLISIVTGILGEFFTALDENWHFVEIHNGQHMTMFAFFLFHCFFELAYYYEVEAIPPYLDYLTVALAFLVEGILFLWHLHGRSMMDVQVHTFLVYSIAATTISLGCELVFKNDVRPCLLRAGAILLQGSWFWCVGFILYPPSGWDPWDQSSHSQMMIVTMMFAWNIAGVLLFECLVGFFVYQRTKRRFFNDHLKIPSNSGKKGGKFEKRDNSEYSKLNLELSEDEDDEDGVIVKPVEVA